MNKAFSNEELIAVCSPYIHKLAYRFALSVSFLTAEDFFQEGVCALLENACVANTTDHAQAYLCVCVRNRFLHLARNEKYRKCDSLQDSLSTGNEGDMKIDMLVRDFPLGDPSREFIDGTAVRIMHDESMNLSGCAREGAVYLLYVTRGMKRPEIAAMFHVSSEHVALCINKARTKLKANSNILSFYKEVG